MMRQRRRVRIRQLVVSVVLTISHQTPVSETGLGRDFASLCSERVSPATTFRNLTTLHAELLRVGVQSVLSAGSHTRVRDCGILSRAILNANREPL